MYGLLRVRRLSHAYTGVSKSGQVKNLTDLTNGAAPACHALCVRRTQRAPTANNVIKKRGAEATTI